MAIRFTSTLTKSNELTVVLMANNTKDMPLGNISQCAALFAAVGVVLRWRQVGGHLQQLGGRALNVMLCAMLTQGGCLDHSCMCSIKTEQPVL